MCTHGLGRHCSVCVCVSQLGLRWCIPAVTIACVSLVVYFHAHDDQDFPQASQPSPFVVSLVVYFHDHDDHGQPSMTTTSPQPPSLHHCPRVGGRHQGRENGREREREGNFHHHHDDHDQRSNSNHDFDGDAAAIVCACPPFNLLKRAALRTLSTC